MNVLVIGPESTGSKLCARICAELLGIVKASEWNGMDEAINKNHKVTHRCIPWDGMWFDPKDFIEGEGINKVVITSRYNEFSIRSKQLRYNKIEYAAVEENKDAIIMLSELIYYYDCMFFSYETLLMYGLGYIDQLSFFLEVNKKGDMYLDKTSQNLSIEITDSNKKYLEDE